MNFFEHQDRAKQTTLYLLGLFAIALMGMTLLLYGLALIVFHDAEQPFRIWNPGLLMLATLIVVGVVGGSSAVKWQALQGGGKVVAEDLGGQLVHPDTADAAQQRLLNVVEEMAIASGISVPAVYLLAQERSINAFAAGLTPENAVIGVTQGSLEQLSRDELQGVIGHEFSHILNGDMRMNLRLIGVLHGILLIYLAGRMMYSRGMIGIAALLHGAHRQSSRPSPSSSQSRRVSRSHWLGLGLMAVGGLGLICGRLIKSAISRQREFLADASSVQFTRNPSGLSGALRKIGGYKAGSSIQVVGVEEASHLFFGEALKLAFWQGIFATHPPLQQRIQRIEGNAWQASTAPPSLSPPVSTQPAPVTMAPPQPVSSRPSPPPAASAKPSQSQPSPPPMVSTGAVLGFAPDSAPTPSTAQLNAEQVVHTVGTVTAQHLAYAQALLRQLSDRLHHATHTPVGALAIVYGLLLDKRDVQQCDRQLVFLRDQEPPDVITQILQMQTDLQQLDLRLRLPLIDLVTPVLRRFSATQRQRILQNVQALIHMDNRITLSEYTLQALLQQRLQQAENRQPSAIEFHQIAPIWADCLTVLSALAHVGHSTPANKDYAFRSGVSRLPSATRHEMPDSLPQINLAAFGKSLTRLRRATPKLKQAVIDACAHTVLLDQTVTVQESELLRIVVISLNCPMPPFLDAPLHNPSS